jgi:hypothetical protein
MIDYLNQISMRKGEEIEVLFPSSDACISFYPLFATLYFH